MVSGYLEDSMKTKTGGTYAPPVMCINVPLQAVSLERARRM